MSADRWETTLLVRFRAENPEALVRAMELALKGVLGVDEVIADQDIDDAG